MRFATPAKVGAFTLITLLAGFAAVRFLGKTGSTSGSYHVFLLLRDAGGVAKRSNVQVAGIPIGQVDEIRLDGDLARLSIRVNSDVVLYDDATGTKTTRNLLGEYFISVSPGTEGRPRLEDGATLRTLGGAASPDELLQDMSQIAKTVDRITRALEESVASTDAQANMRKTLSNLAEVTTALNQTVNENRQSIRNILAAVEQITRTGKNDINQILDDVKTISGELRELVAEPAPAPKGGEPGDKQDGSPPAVASGKDGAAAEGLTTTDKIRALVDRVAASSENLEKTLAHLEVTTGRIERGEGTLGRLTQDDQLIDNIEDVTSNISDYVTGLSQLHTILALRSDYQLRTQTVKSFLELRLQPREDKYYAIEIVNDPRGLTKLEQTNVSTTNPNEPNQYQEIRSVTTNALRFSLQLAQRLGPLVGRFGIKESTGGVGLDVLLLDDAFELRQDLFGFGEVVRPRWRLSIGYAFLNHLWLMGGVDDALSLDRREYFAGMQLRFDDQDLKTILPFAPKP
jgi:phospholipid/cholesterol/gamma-HCH transport system substrate-binding protein